MEVVYIPADGPEKGEGVIQCRAKQQISQGTLRLYPHGGTFIHMADGTGRSKMEKSSGIKSCYIKAVEVSGTVRKDKRQHHEKSLMYSAMSHKKVASQKLDDTHCAFLGCDVGRPRYSRDGQHDSAHGGIHIPEAGPENSSGSEDWIDNEFAVASFDVQK